MASNINIILAWIPQSSADIQINGLEPVDVKADPGGGHVVTAQHFASPGDDSAPLVGDYFADVPAPGRGERNAVGYFDALNQPQALPGEKRIYGRSPDGSVTCEVWLKNDGTVEINSLNANVIKIGNVTIDSAGNISTPGDVTAGSGGGTAVSLQGHQHGYIPGTLPAILTLPPGAAAELADPP